MRIRKYCGRVLVSLCPNRIPNRKCHKLYKRLCIRVFNSGQSPRYKLFGNNNRIDYNKNGGDCVVRNIIFDLDGTIADLYGTDNWKAMLETSDVTPYIKAKPLCDMRALRDKLLSLSDVHIVVVSWGAVNASQEYMRQIRKAKIEWLHKWKFPFDEVHIVKYGTNKYSTLKHKHQESYLFDDNSQVREKFSKNPQCYAYTEKEIFKVLGVL